jgi:thiol-disulfide isomerase/thioredoxin
MRRFFALILVLTALMALSSASGQGSKSEQSRVYIKLHGIDGTMYDVAKMKGEVVLVSFGATWCQPCYAELKALEELKQEYAGKPVKLLWVSIDSRQERTDRDLRSFAQRMGISFPVLRDPTQLTYAQFSTRVRVPMIVFFDREGHLFARRHFGMGEADLFKKGIRETIDGLLQTPSAETAALRRHF